MEAIDMLLNDLESEILKAKRAAFSNTDVIVNRKNILDLIARVRANLPQVIQDAMRINRDESEIISRANAYAQSAMQAADAKVQNAVNESEITKQAEHLRGALARLRTAQSRRVLHQRAVGCHSSKHEQPQLLTALFGA